MTKRSTYFNIPGILAFVLIASCAKINSPVGGPKDKEPPVIVKSDPVKGQTNFKEKKITITFNEFIALDKINEKFMVSPPMEKKPRVFLKGKSVVIEYDEDLKDSTTYTFYFQDAIRDLNEANSIDNYQFVISTGSVVDSLSVTGNVYNAFSLDPPEDALVMLYKDMSDSAVMKELPDYITKAGKTGYFRIDNVKKGIYKLYALKDADNSKNFNLPDEEFAFLDQPVEVTVENNYLPPVPDTSRVKLTGKKVADTVLVHGEHQLFLFKPEKKRHYLNPPSRTMQYKLIYTLSLPPDTIGFDFSIPGAGQNSYFIEKSKEKDTIQIWLTDSVLYSKSQLTTLVGYPFTDSLGNVVKKQDTVLLRFLIPKATRAKPKPTIFRFTSSLTSGSIKPEQEIIFKSQTPFRIPDTSKIRLYEIKEKDKITLPYKLKKDDKNSCRIVLLAQLKQGKTYSFIADSAAFGNIYGEQADSSGTKFNVRNDDSFGKLKLNINNFEGNRIIQLLTSDEKPVHEVLTNKNGKTEFTYLDGGLYRLRVIYDLNGDGKWTTGDFPKKRQPEPVSFYFQELSMRENLWLDQDWDISQKKIKKVKSKLRNNTGR
jgi:hypothetical protein